MYPRKFENAINAFRRLPGVGAKTAERYAYEVLSWDPELQEELIKAMEELPKVKRCTVCGNLSEGDFCEYCSDPNRNKDMICVVQSPKDINAIENMGLYDGLYHVLNGAIDTQKGILPENLNITSLLNRISENTKEIILATDPTVEGETTAMYLSRLLSDKVKVTRLASGLPMGGHLDYSDSRTLQKAFTGRTKASNEQGI